MKPKITCKLCLENNSVVFMYGSEIHNYNSPLWEKGNLVVCADATFIPDGLPVAESKP